jgi:hypothetical protein
MTRLLSPAARALRIIQQDWDAYDRCWQEQKTCGEAALAQLRALTDAMCGALPAGPVRQPLRAAVLSHRS